MVHKFSLSCSILFAMDGKRSPAPSAALKMIKFAPDSLKETRRYVKKVRRCQVGRKGTEMEKPYRKKKGVNTTTIIIIKMNIQRDKSCFSELELWQFNYSENEISGSMLHN